MNLNFNTITDERGEEIAELFDQFFHNPNTLQFTGQELFKLFTEKYIDTRGRKVNKQWRLNHVAESEYLWKAGEEEFTFRFMELWCNASIGSF